MAWGMESRGEAAPRQVVILVAGALTSLVTLLSAAGHLALHQAFHHPSLPGEPGREQGLQGGEAGKTPCSAKGPGENGPNTPSQPLTGGSVSRWRRVKGRV